MNSACIVTDSAVLLADAATGVRVKLILPILHLNTPLQFNRNMRTFLFSIPCVQRCLPLTCLRAHSTTFTCTWQFDYGQ